MRPGKDNVPPCILYGAVASLGHLLRGDGSPNCATSLQVLLGSAQGETTSDTLSMRHCVQCSRAGSLWVVLFRVAPEARSAQLRCLLRTAAAATTTTTTIWLGKMGRSGVPFPLRFACPTLQQMAKGYSCGKGLVGPCIGRNDVEVLAIAEVAALCQTQPQNS